MDENEIRAKLPEEIIEAYQIKIEKGKLTLYGRRDSNAVYIPIELIIAIKENTSAYDINYTFGYISLFKGEQPHTIMGFWDLKMIKRRMNFPEAIACLNKQCGFNHEDKCEKTNALIIDEKGMCES